MASTTTFAGNKIDGKDKIAISKGQLYESIGRLSDWLERNDYRGYDTFDGLNARWIRPLTFESTFLRLYCSREYVASPSISALSWESQRAIRVKARLSLPADSCAFTLAPVTESGGIRPN